MSRQRAGPEARTTEQTGCSPVLSCPWCLGEMRDAEVRGAVPLHTSNQPTPADSITAFSACRSLLRSRRLSTFHAACIDASNNIHGQASNESFAADSQCMQGTDGATPSTIRGCRLTNCCRNASLPIQSTHPADIAAASGTANDLPVVSHPLLVLSFARRFVLGPA